MEINIKLKEMILSNDSELNNLAKVIIETDNIFKVVCFSDSYEIRFYKSIDLEQKWEYLYSELYKLDCLEQVCNYDNSKGNRDVFIQ